MIREMTASDIAEVLKIYGQALVSGTATFNTVCPTAEQWDKGHLRDGRFVDVTEGKITGWIAVSPTSPREAYKGVVEVSVYVDENFRGKGIGTGLLKKLCAEMKNYGYWSLYAAVFSSNEASIALHKKCGFREIGFRERIAKDKFGRWQNTTLLEYRSADCESFQDLEDL